MEVLMVFMDTFVSGFLEVHLPLDIGKGKLDQCSNRGKTPVVALLFGSKPRLTSDPSFHDAAENAPFSQGAFSLLGDVGTIRKDGFLLLLAQLIDEL